MSLPYIITSPCHIDNSGSTPGQFRFNDGTNQINIEAPNALSTSYTFTLPEDDGNSGDLLFSEGTATTFWGRIGYGLFNVGGTLRFTTVPTNLTVFIDALSQPWPFGTTNLIIRGFMGVSKSDVVPAEIRFAVNGVLVPGSFRTVNCSTPGAFQHAETQCLITLNNGDDLQLQIRNAPGSLSSTIYNNPTYAAIQII